MALTPFVIETVMFTLQGQIGHKIFIGLLSQGIEALCHLFISVKQYYPVVPTLSLVSVLTT